MAVTPNPQPINLTGLLASGIGTADQFERLGDLEQMVREGTQSMAANAISGTQFKPFTVTAGRGTASVGADGGLALSHDPAEQALIDMLGTGTHALFNQAFQPTGKREGDIYEAIRAMQRPEEDRQRVDLEGRLLSQGRLGMANSMFGASPEEFAFEKAIQEAQNTAAFEAMNQARAQQLQSANLGGMFQQASFLPQAQLLNALNPALNTANLSQTGQIAGTNLASQLGLGGLQASVNTEKVRAELLAGLLNQATGALNRSGVDPLSDAYDFVKGKLEELF